MRFLVLGLCGATLVAACHDEPGYLCDRSRIVWPPLAIDPSSDLDPATPGIQVDLALRSALPDDSVAVLSVIAPDGTPTPHPEAVAVDPDGGMVFHGVTLPEGRIQLSLVVQNRCGQVSSVRQTYVWDGLGFPACDLELVVEPVATATYPAVWNRGVDADPGADGLQTTVKVLAGRPDMTVRLFVRDLATGIDQIYRQPTGDDDAAEFPITVAEGDQAIRAVCVWTPEDLRPSSITRRVFVDSVAPDCAITRPASAVTPADDVDPDVDGIQVEETLHSDAADVDGEVPSFQDGAVTGSAMTAGEGSAIATLVGSGPFDLSGQIADHAGNLCVAAVVR